MTNRFNKLALATTALFALGLGATGASAAPASANAVAKARVLKQLTITNTSALDFGTIVTSGTASTVAVNAAGGVTCGANLTCTGTTKAASFNVTGTNNATVLVSVASKSIVLKNSADATQTMTATLVVPADMNLGNSGNSTGAVLNIGGSLAIGATQADGVYQSDNFAVTVNYQ